MIKIQKTISKRVDELSKIVTVCEKSLQNAPKGRLRSSLVGKTVRYYFCELPGLHSGKYLKKSDEPLIRALAQKEYEQKVLSAATAELKKLQDLCEFFRHSSMESVDQLIHENKKSKINPFFFSDEEYAQRWQSLEFEKSDFEADDDLISDRGEKMRSKSEVLIANALSRHGIPYHYEKPLMLDGKKIFPDFTVLNLENRSEYIWEHFGLMSNQNYVENALYKMTRYMANGILPGKNFIFSLESESVKFGTRQIEKIISGYLL